MFLKKSLKISAEKCGKNAEEKAVQYLNKAGFCVLLRRKRTPYGEIDIVAENNSLIIVVEVKMRKTLEEAVFALSDRQKKRLTQAAEFILPQLQGSESKDIRFDYICFDRAGHMQIIPDIIRLEV